MAAATGLKADVRHGLLWVAGEVAAPVKAAVYDLDTGDGVTALTLTAVTTTGRRSSTTSS